MAENKWVSLGFFVAPISGVISRVVAYLVGVFLKVRKGWIRKIGIGTRTGRPQMYVISSKPSAILRCF